jgi:glycosyltransferase involved in cell wall biosynthesis
MEVSVLIPVYNTEKFLPKCLDSVLSQTYSDLQIVLIDDGSKDASWEICQEYASRDARIEAWHQENKGVAATRNSLLDKVNGDYVLFVDSDDWIEPDMVEFLINKAKENEAEVTVCGMVINNSTVRKEYTESILNQEECVRAFLFHSELRGSLCNKLVATNLLHNVRFHPGLSYGEDALFCWHFFQNAQKIVMTDRQLYHYRMNETSISHQSFGEKKLTGHLTWSIITEETSKWWPQFLPIAQARWGLEDMYLLRQAGQSNYKKNNAIHEIQTTVKMFIPQMKSSGLLRGREIFNAYMMCHWYGYNILYNILYKTFRR